MHYTWFSEQNCFPAIRLLLVRERILASRKENCVVFFSGNAVCSFALPRSESHIISQKSCPGVD